MEHPIVRYHQATVYINGDLSRKCDVRVYKATSLKDLIHICQERLGVDRHTKCVLFDSKGVELSDDDLEYADPEEPWFLSQGEEFSSLSILALYKEIQFLGKGGFGSVWLYKHRNTHRKVAIKFTEIASMHSSIDIGRVYSEIALLRSLSHPNIVQLLDAFALEEQICFVMEYCSGGELKNYVKQTGPLPEDQVYKLSYQLLRAIRYCHNSGVVHRDLKLENILFASKTDRTQLKIVDFGISGVFSIGHSGERSNAGSLLYISPEVLSKRDTRAHPAIDVWSMGCIVYYLLTTQHPFMGETQQQVINKILKGEYPKLPVAVSKSWHVLLRGMLRVNPEKRWSVDRVISHLLQPCSHSLTDDEEEKDPVERRDNKNLRHTTKKNTVVTQRHKVQIEKTDIAKRCATPGTPRQRPGRR